MKALPQTLAAAAAWLLPSAGAQAQVPWSLWVFEPAQPGRLENCTNDEPRADPVRLEVALTIHWDGGDLVQPEGPEPQKPWSPFNACFVLKAGPQTIAAGAIVPRASAHLLRIPTLVLQGDSEKPPLRFELVPSFRQN